MFMWRAAYAVVPTLSLILAVGISIGAQQSPQQQATIKSGQRKLVEEMLQNIHEALKKNYYDPSFHGLDVDERDEEYSDRLKKTETLGEAFRVVAAYLSGLHDSHTVFVPPARENIADYGYRMQIVGDSCYVTQVRPGSDAEQKIHRGDQIMSLDGYALGRVDFWQLQYYLNQLAPRPFSDMTVRSPSGETRKVVIATKYTKVEHYANPTPDQSDFWEQRAEHEKRQQGSRSRFVERGDLLFWRMPEFLADDGDVGRMIALARSHKTLVLDLRGNPGGSVVTLLRLVGSVMDHDVTIAKRVTRKGQEPMIAKSRGKDRFTGNLIVLVDSGSASASEVFARVVQLEHRGTVIGDRSSGSVMEAELYHFADYSGVLVFYGAEITEADLIMADGRSLEKVGVTPDVVLLPTATQIEANEDPVLAKAAQLAGTELNPKEAGQLFPFEWAVQSTI